MNLGFEFRTTAAKPKRQSDDAPTQVPMRGTGTEVRRKPSADQKKVRRQMARQRKTAGTLPDCPSCGGPLEADTNELDGSTFYWCAAEGRDFEKCHFCSRVAVGGTGENATCAEHFGTAQRIRSENTKESTMSRQREAELLQAMAKADLPEQRRLAKELEDLRAEASMQVQSERDLDLADTVIRDTLTPVRVHERHTAATDWITEVPTVAEGSYDHEMRTEATLWFRNVHQAVREDREEFAEQAQGMARRMAGKYGEAAPAAARVFLDTAARLHRTSSDQNGYGESTVTDYDTKADQDPLYAEDWDHEEGEGVHPPMPGAGEAANSINTPTASRKTAVSLTNVGIEGDHGVGTDPSGNRVKFRLSEKDKADLKAVLYSDLAVNFSGVDVEEGDIIKDARRRTAAEGQTCSVCGDKIAKDPSGEDPSTWHHDNGEKHDHEAKPSGDSKESVRKQAEGPTNTFPCRDCGTTVERWRGEYDVNCPRCGAPHNAGGQRLRDDYAGNPSMYDENIGDLEGYEMQHAYDASRRTAAGGNEYKGGSPQHGDIAVCHKDNGTIQFFNGEWMHLKGGPSHNDVYPATPKEKESSLRTTASRPIYEIARDIQREWGPNVNFGAKPYLDAMRQLSTMDDRFYEDSAKTILAYFLSNAGSFRGPRAKELKDEIKVLLGRKVSGRGDNTFSLSDAKNEDGEWVMSPEQIRAEMAANDEPYDPYEDDHYASRRQADNNPNGPKTDDGGAESSLPDVEVGSENDRPMWPWELNEGDPANGEDAANVANVPTPGGESGYPQPKNSSREVPIPAQGRTADFRARVQAGLARMGEVDRDPFVREAMPSPEALGVNVGDFFVSSWGYDQTNVDFYQVVGLTGASVRVREVYQRTVDSPGSGVEYVVPEKDNFRGEVMTKRLNDGGGSGKPGISINSYSGAWLWDGKPKYRTATGWGH